MSGTYLLVTLAKSYMHYTLNEHSITSVPLKKTSFESIPPVEWVPLTFNLIHCLHALYAQSFRRTLEYIVMTCAISNFSHLLHKHQDALMYTVQIEIGP